MVLDFVRSCKNYYEVNGIRVYPSEKMMMLEIDEFYIVIQAHDEDTWKKLLDLARSDPEYIRRIADYLETANEVLIPGTISVMRLKKEDFNGFLPLYDTNM